MHELVLPNDTNNLGNVLGGRVMHLMDICAAMSAYKHARSHVVTASVDNMNFLERGDIPNDNKLNDSEKAMTTYEKLLLEYNSSIYITEARKRFRILRGDN